MLSRQFWQMHESSSTAGSIALKKENNSILWGVYILPSAPYTENTAGGKDGLGEHRRVLMELGPSSLSYEFLLPFLSLCVQIIDLSIIFTNNA